MGIVVQLLVLTIGVACVVMASPLQRVDDDSELNKLIPDLMQSVRDVFDSGKGIQKQLLATLQDIADTQKNLQSFLQGGATVTSEMTSGEAETLESQSNNVVYFTRNVVAALQSGNNTQLSDILLELKNLNDNFKSHFKAVSCPEPYIPLGEECFNFYLEDLSWNEARDRCLRIGGDLAVPKNLTQVRLFINQHFPRKNRRNFWLGGLENNKVWEWLSGDAVNPDLWYTNEPSGNGDCLAMFDGWDHPLSDFPCQNERRSICERVKRTI